MLEADQLDIIRDYVFQGKTPTEIVRLVDFKVSRQAVKKQIDKNGWLPRVAEPSEVTIDIPDGMSPIKAAIVAQIALHGTPSLAYKAVGVARTTYRDWTKKDDQFRLAIEAAQAQLNGAILEVAKNAALKDPKYSWEWMQKHPSLRGDFGQVKAQTNIGTLKIGHLIQRDPSHIVPRVPLDD